MKLRLILDVEYKPNTTTEEQLRANLGHMVSHAMGDGWITGPTDAEVESWDMRVHRVDEPSKEVSRDRN